MARGDTSTPTASAPRAAASSACSPVPQPTSSTRPQSRPLSARRTNAGCGRPTSHGGGVLATYAASQSGGCVVIAVPLLAWSPDPPARHTIHPLAPALQVCQESPPETLSRAGSGSLRPRSTDGSL